MKPRALIPIILTAVTFSLTLFWSSPAIGNIQVRFQYLLSNFQGPIPYHWAELAIDPQNNEVYALNKRENEIRIFDEHGMEIYRFGEHKELVGLRDMAVARNGEIFVLARKSTGTTILRCNYRGEPVAEFELQEVPNDFTRFRPDHIYYHQGHLYLADSFALKILMADTDGHFRQGFNIKPLIMEQSGSRFEAEELDETEITGFGVDQHGNMLFTIPTLFTAYRLSPAGTLEIFGSSGSAPGKFGVVAGIAADDQDRIYVADRLRCVVLIFDRQLNFLTEFGYRGPGPANLIVPNDVTIGADGAIYVAQAAYKGVSVFKAFPTYEELARK